MTRTRNLVLFDFDGTITKKDSFTAFIRFYKGSASFYFGVMILLPVLLLYKIGISKNWKVKEVVLKYFFRKEPEEKFYTLCKSFAQHVIPKIVKREALNSIEKHLKNGDRVIVVTASAEDWVKEWCLAMNLELIGTRLEKRDGRLTGRLAGLNCYGKEKVKRIKQLLDVNDYATIYAYGDSKGDEAMLKLADIPVLKPFK